ncbi:tetratricopeptide repeat protein [Brachymonas sp. J145]|uniref:tetratricopeptide repeat protein n=1 Tax=Brachymonas sp. J145 TaxID=3116489 RepID=UPI002E780B50|nr:tetratricopeptide repeat protein [Brachymonas sp. J145]MEE1653119.1 tetratricopeptide repeat protein [Brachymonas sp. J145]
MQRFSLLALSLAAAMSTTPALAATTPGAEALIAPRSAAQQAADRTALQAVIESSTALYDTLAGELYVQRNNPSRGFIYLMDAARRTQDGRLYARAVEIALQGRAPDAALTAIRSWQTALPNDPNADTYQLQVLLMLDRVSETADPLRQALAHASGDKRQTLIHNIPSYYLNVKDQQQALGIVREPLQPYVEQRDTAFVAALAMARMQMLARDFSPSLQMLERSQQATPPEVALGALLHNRELPGLVAMDLMRASRQEQPDVARRAELLARKIATAPQATQEIQLAYAKTLIEIRRHDDALKQLDLVLRRHPDYAMAWMLQGGLQLQEKQWAAAEKSLQQYFRVRKAEDPMPGPREDGNIALSILQANLTVSSDMQANIMMAEIADHQNDPAAAARWLERIQPESARHAAMVQRAETLNSLGKYDLALQQIRALPADNDEQRQVRSLAEAQLLDRAGRHAEALRALDAEIARSPENAELLYARGMTQERLGNYAATEQDMRKVMALRPDSPNAFNALGYTLADRNERLPEAKELIRKALDLSPDSGAIQDSMGWVEYRLGNLPEARRWLEKAFVAEPQAEVAAHLAEVLWTIGDREAAGKVFEEGLVLDKDDTVLKETMQRLGYTPRPAATPTRP